ncbi:MAG TPA: response regulator [Kofleriaceae bacterium]|jgi:CheY-like chemotaxis protein
MAGEHILIVDDTEMNRKLLQVLLTAKGYRVSLAVTAEEALAQLPTTKPALMLLDLRLPGMSGLELARKLRTDPAYADLVIIAVTANAMKGDEDDALAAGCNAYITKPIDTRAFPTLIATHLSARAR